MPKRKVEELHYAIWPTAWGRMGAVAGPSGLRHIVLPGYQADELAELLAWEHPGAVCDETPFKQIIQLTRDYFNAKVVDFGQLRCDLPAVGSFTVLVCRACRKIPYGQTLSYSGLAREVGRSGAARAVATAMSKNPLPLVVPCHRVIYADGQLGGFSSRGGVALKQRLLEMEKKALGTQAW